MSYQVLARKWRPRAFGQVVGQEHVVRALTNALDQQRLHHAYLFTGTRGVGKTTLARIVAKALNCETGITSTPCCQCTACVEIDKGRFVDLIEVDAASNTQVDAMRELLENAQYAPTAGRFKVYIIDEVHMLSRSAFNAMLKTLEEPPAHVKFILATTDPQKVPVTVLSRCLQFNLKQMGPGNIAGHLQNILDQEGISAEPVALQLLSRAAEGSMRDALSLLDQAIAYGSGSVHEQEVRAMLGAIDQSYLFNLLDALTGQDGPSLISQAEAMDERSISFDAALQELASLLHQIALIQAVPQAVADDVPERPRMLALAQRIPAEQIQLFYQIATLGRRDLSLAPDEYAGFTMTLLRMLAFAPLEQSAPIQVAPPKAPAVPTPPPAVQPPVARAEEPIPFQESQRQASTPEPKPAEKAPIEAKIDTLRSALQNPVAGGFSGDWRTFVDSLKPGFAKTLAQNCELVSSDEQNLVLCVRETQKHLLEPRFQEMLKTALRDRFGNIKISIEIGGTGNTPAAQLSQEKALRQAQAEESIRNDPFVQGLMETFGAIVNPSSIKPIQ
ncbi:DNA polymerase III subunit gamma/tau [Novimethylophilus kurashikiensis]|uniref:DNA polymerase III subunit gamma/tau n=1 Tax=Novimethylophilus kurashikiensis TaxID=1825523 RepID=A0A2R5FCW7_9PROT|nr:DNA polymerase III subunit gamma/tau [Novimethylophilus kurashikiensis]GBG16040.1 DNA polymerase III subunit gamma/tau [Novimethylophilus kurashikiensis]